MDAQASISNIWWHGGNSSHPTHDARCYSHMEGHAEQKPQNAIIGAAEAATISTKPPFSPAAKAATPSCTGSWLRSGMQWATSYLLRQQNPQLRRAMSSSPTTSVPNIKHDPVDFMCAGAKFRWEDGQITGRFNPLDLAFWNCVVGFHRAISIKHQAESVSYHKWHEESQQYHTIIPWQTTSEGGLSVNTDWKRKENVELLDEYARQFKREFFPACTIHTHVNVAAFESGTDAHDEEDNPGWHITLGHLLSYDTYDIAARMRVPRKKSLSAVMGTKHSLKLKESHLFSSDIVPLIDTIPGTTDWHQFIPRVKAV